ncbi:hypothetical protein M422DRAFT_270769 [Sphaerobolus stellatus SS14]|uniref:Uncharacterized protein n=1 Tax=Sphaerobolus stellatus (strain SS14) TaxID=990650 RepID=A0A0C9URM6_SPHS4|nr:hypothetical protein M422DRAFT_270769 [Sphaerobolus stellatus SS14]
MATSCIDCQHWFMCTIASNILLELKNVIQANSKNSKKNLVLKEFTPYVLYFAAGTLGGVDAPANGNHPPQVVPDWKGMHNMKVVIDWVDGKAEADTIAEQAHVAAEEDRLFEGEHLRILADTSFHTQVRTWDPVMHSWVPNEDVIF